MSEIRSGAPRGGLVLLVVLAALAAALAARDYRGLDLREVQANVDSLRATVLSLEQTRGQAPLPCGQEPWAWEALGAASTDLGDCGRTYMGRTTPGRGRYWIAVAPGGVDFEVNGLARQGRAVLRVTATRQSPAQVTAETAQ